MTWDLIIRGGEVIDPAGQPGHLDIAVSQGKIAAVGTDLGKAAEVVDATGKIVTPGLVDMHTHVFAGGTFWGIEPDPVACDSGVTTWVDAGSAGAYNVGALLERRYQVKVPVLLNISAVGLVAPTGEALNLSHCDSELAAKVVTQHQLRGIKVRMDRNNADGIEPLKRAVAAASGVPVMVHIGPPPPDFGELLEHLRPGDIITHCASSFAAGAVKLHPAMRDAYQMGLHFDVGHGMGGFAFDVMEAQLAAGIVPHSISTDLHTMCLNGPVFDLPTTMAKMIALGMTLPQVVAAATIAPARALGLDAGTLNPGAPADIAIFTVESGQFTLTDTQGQQRIAPVKLTNEATFVNGRRLAPQPKQDMPPWIS